MVTPAVIMIDSALGADVLPTLSLTVTLKLEVPATVGVPLITPLEAFSDKPAGSVPVLTVQLLYGGVPPVACSVVFGYAAPTMPLGREVVVMVGGAAAGLTTNVTGSTTGLLWAGA